MSEPVALRATRYEFREQHLADLLRAMMSWVAGRPHTDTDVGTVDISYNTTIGYWHASLYLREDG